MTVDASSLGAAALAVVSVVVASMARFQVVAGNHKLAALGLHASENTLQLRQQEYTLGLVIVYRRGS